MLFRSDSAAYKNLEESVLEPWRNMILRQIVADSGETVALPKNGAPITLSQSTHSAATAEGMHAAAQAVPSKLGRSYGPIGSGAPFLSISPLLQAIKNGQSDDPTAQQFPPLQSAANPTRSSGGYGSFAIPAGVFISTFDSFHAAAQALTVAIETPEHDSVTGVGNAGQPLHGVAGGDTLKGNGTDAPA